MSSAVRDQRWRRKQRGWIHTRRMLLLLIVVAVVGKRRDVIAVYPPPQRGSHSPYQSLESDTHRSTQQQQVKSYPDLGLPSNVPPLAVGCNISHRDRHIHTVASLKDTTEDRNEATTATFYGQQRSAANVRCSTRLMQETREDAPRHASIVQQQL